MTPLKNQPIKRKNTTNKQLKNKNLHDVIQKTHTKKTQRQPTVN